MEQLKLVTNRTNEKRNFPGEIWLRRYTVACALTGAAIQRGEATLD
jgi:hypothetical protein